MSYDTTILMEHLNPESFGDLINAALREDLDEAGDVTSKAVFTDELSRATLVSKDQGILAGSAVFTAAMHKIDADTNVVFSMEDGSDVRPGDEVAVVLGKVLSILAAERVALNFLSYLSGIATATRSFVERARSSGSAVILDTRKTLPGYRALAKYAVRAGGGTNHRMGLYDMVLLKDNHIDMAGSITLAVERIRNVWGDSFAVEVECRTLDEVQEALGCDVDRIMLDNMSVDRVREAVDRCGGKVKLEASGNITGDLVGEMSETGVDYISVGQITHSVKSFDYSLVKAKESSA